MIIKKSQIVTVSLAVLVAAAGYVNWTYNKEYKNKQVSSGEQEIHLVENEEGVDYFEKARQDRADSRTEVRETLAELADNDDMTGDTRAKAEEDCINVAKQTDCENTIESLIRARGFEDAVVYISGNHANAVIKAEELTSEQATQIAEIISDNTGIAASEIKVSLAE